MLPQSESKHFQRLFLSSLYFKNSMYKEWIFMYNPFKNCFKTPLKYIEVRSMNVECYRRSNIPLGLLAEIIMMDGDFGIFLSQ
uniref:Maturase K n=1 Tax=Pyxicephalus adspersus TaxID=30357 RepID=A0AAV3AZD0_PYXAD|nr:TPA: hypothetical protein GDO54_006121 [Pyxicephalus adspersus]